MNGNFVAALAKNMKVEKEQMIAVQVKRCKIMNEFSREQQDKYFGISIQKTLHHIDTLYYAVTLNEPEHIVTLQENNDLPEYITHFVSELRGSKEVIKTNQNRTVEYGELEMVAKAFATYEFCLSIEEKFDIFIASYLPNADTPRVVVQLRSRYLVLDGVKKAVEESLSYLKEFLKPFGLFPVKVRENRIDYAFHTNLIQNPYKFFQDKNLKEHCKTNLRLINKFMEFTEDDLKIDTVSFGNRKSNNVFVRMYNKGKEVIKNNYKAFFIQRWFDNHLISEFDKYVYEEAYKLRSYRTGILVGRLKWYLEFGTDEEIKELCQNLLNTNFIKSDNCAQIEKKIRNIIPEVTLIFNIEYQTKRKFYATCCDFFDNFVDFEELDIAKLFGVTAPVTVPTEEQQAVSGITSFDPLLKDIYLILGNARAIIDYLTGYGNVVSFVQDRKMSKKQFLEEGEPYMRWWKRIRGTQIDYSADKILELYRCYDQNASILKSRRLFQGQVARLAILKNQSTEAADFFDDLADALCTVNDNDKRADENGVPIEPPDYQEIRAIKARRMRGLVKKPVPEN